VDSYVVQIFRRPGQGGERLVGLVERIGSGEHKAFQSEAQLLEYLSQEAPSRGQKPSCRNSSKKT
jgi:oligoribonuclease (3'-5' exoribonuclease)